MWYLALRGPVSHSQVVVTGRARCFAGSVGNTKRRKSSLIRKLRPLSSKGIRKGEGSVAVLIAATSIWNFGVTARLLLFLCDVMWERVRQSPLHH